MHSFSIAAMVEVRSLVGFLGLRAADGTLHAGGDVGDLLQLVQEDGRAAALIGHGGGDETVGQKVLTGLVDTLDALAGAVVVGHHQSLARHEGRGAVAGVAQRGKAGVVEPAGGWLEAVARVPVLQGWDVELPHLSGFEAGVFLRRSLLRRGRGGDEQEGGEYQE